MAEVDKLKTDTLLQSLDFKTGMWLIGRDVMADSPFPVVTQLFCGKEIPELEGILSVWLPQGSVYYNAAALRAGSKAEQR